MTRPFPTKPTRALLLVAACLGAAACARDDGAPSLEASIAAPQGQPRTELMALAPEHPSRHGPIVALPPEAGAVRDVRAHAYVNGLRQDVALAGSAYAPVRNGITVLARTTAAPTLDERVPLAPPTEAGIRSEIGAAFPHLAMQVVERASSNMYGPYGLALGRAGGDVRCLFAWQWIDTDRMPAGAAGPLSLRVRLCQAGTSFDAMAALVDHLAIGAGPDASVAAVDIVAPREAPRKGARHRVHAARPRPSRLARREVVAPIEAVSAEPRAVTTAFQAPAAAPPTPFAADLPPQALLGPKAGGKPGSMATAANPH